MKQWKIVGQWKMLSLGRGYYEFSFASLADLRAIWALGTINLKPGFYACLSGLSISMRPPKDKHMRMYGYRC